MSNDFAAAAPGPELSKDQTKVALNKTISLLQLPENVAKMEVR